MPDWDLLPGDLRVPFIFVPHGAPEPTEWLAEHPGWVKFPATFVPRYAESSGPPVVPQDPVAGVPATSVPRDAASSGPPATVAPRHTKSLVPPIVTVVAQAVAVDTLAEDATLHLTRSALRSPP